MTTCNLETLFYLCDKTCDGVTAKESARKIIQRCWQRSTPEWQNLAERRHLQHERWRELSLNRQHSGLLREVLEWGQAELEFLELALAHVGQWLKDSSPQQLTFAKSRLQMADQAHRRYFRGRLALEPVLVDKMISQGDFRF